jgi:hypothetical protein
MTDSSPREYRASHARSLLSGALQITLAIRSYNAEMVESLEWLAYLKVTQLQGSGDLDEARQAAVLLDAAEARREAMGAPIQPANHAHHTEQVQAIRSRLGTEAFNAAWQVGRALRIDQAIEDALQGV